jgi:hypothetical protein
VEGRDAARQADANDLFDPTESAAGQFLAQARHARIDRTIEICPPAPSHRG